MEDVGRRTFLRLLLLSAFAHGLAVSALIAMPFLPRPRSAPMLPVVTVDLVAPPRAARPAPTPAKPAPKPLPKPAPKVAKKVLLPKKPRTEPKAAPKAAPAPRKPEPAAYEDVLAQLRQEQGEPAPEAAPKEAPEAAVPGEASAPASGPTGLVASAELRAWIRAARLHVSRAWLLAPGLRAQGLVAHVRVRLDAQGNLVGEPEITRRSGNPWFDESLVRAIQKASPLPAPPEPGEWVFIFDPEVYL